MLKAEERFNKGTPTKVDEVLLALWEETKDQARIIREMATKLDMMSTKEEGLEPHCDVLTKFMNTFVSSRQM